MSDAEPKGILRKGGEERKPKGEIKMVVEETSDNTSDNDKKTARRSRLVRKQTGAAPTDEEEQARKRIVKTHMKGEGAALKNQRSSNSGGESGSEVESHSQIGRSSDVTTTKTPATADQPATPASSRRGCVLF